jgi:hypothetical protein
MVLTATVAPGDAFPATSDPDALRRQVRVIAQESGAGLIEADRIETSTGTSGRMIYKTPRGSGFLFTGMLWMPVDGGCIVWAVAAGESGMTGVREAIITGELLNAGKLTPETYQQSWAQDPYDPLYRGVDRKTLRYFSDDEQFDARFPDHPLTRVRQVLAEVGKMATI